MYVGTKRNVSFHFSSGNLFCRLLSICVADLFSSLLVSSHFCFLLFWSCLLLSPRVLVFHFCCLCLVFFQTVLLSVFLFSFRLFSPFSFRFSPLLLWLRCVGTAGSQSERSQSGAGGQHPAGERCSEDKPSCTRTGNKAREPHLEG